MSKMPFWFVVVSLATITGLYWLTWPFSITTFDLARDIAIASSIARGDAFPMQGPMLAGAVHAGPLWYYVFGIPFVFAPSVLPALMFVGALSALKIPLAYLIGARYADRPTGLLWALMLILPGWETYEGILVLHPSLVATCTLGFVWFALGYAREGRPAQLVAAGLAWALALHAHPSTYGLGFLLLAAGVYRHRKAKEPARTYLLVAIAIVVPFLPYILFQQQAGFPDWRSATSYLSNPHNLGSLWQVPEAANGLFVTGPAALVDGFAENSGLRGFAAPAFGFVYLAAMIGLAISVIGGRRRKAIAGMALAFVILLLSVVAVRADTPFHMTYVLWVFAAGLLALGLRGWLDIRFGYAVAAAAVAFAAATIVALQLSVAGTLERGDYRFTLLPLFDIKRALPRDGPMPFVPAHALAASGELLCASSSISIHGVFAVHLLHDYAIEAHLACRDTSHIWLGGRNSADTPHLAGVSAAFAEALKVPIAEWLGPVGIAPVAQVVHPLVGRQVPMLQTYPPATDLNDRPESHAIEFEASPREIVLVTNIYFTFSAFPEVRAMANGLTISPSVRDQVSSAYVCSVCATDAPVRWRLDISAPALDRIDIVTIAPQWPVGRRSGSP
jgi:hypothetical protein